jgi:hypothetical protein
MKTLPDSRVSAVQGKTKAGSEHCRKIGADQVATFVQTERRSVCAIALKGLKLVCSYPQGRRTAQGAWRRRPP